MSGCIIINKWRRKTYKRCLTNTDNPLKKKHCIHESRKNYKKRIEKEKKYKIFTHIRHTTIDQKLNEKPQPITAKVQTDNPTPMSRNGFTLQNLNYMTSRTNYTQIILTI